MNEIFDVVDDLGPVKVAHLTEQRSGLRAIVVIDNVAAGPAIGGVRMAPDVSFDECRALARAMTLKNAMAALRHGGAKAVIAADHRLDRAGKESLVRAFARAIGDLVDYVPGPDMGTDELCMAWIHDEIGRSVGLPAALGGIPLDVLGATGFGLAAAIDVAAPRVGIALQGARIVVQGYGSVGRHVARFLAERGAVLVGVSDSRGAAVDPAGLDLAELDRVKAEGASVSELRGGGSLASADLVGVECDIWIPAARPDALTADNVDRLQARMVVEGANVATTREADAVLAERGILCLPDFVVNAGGVICGAVEYAGGSERQAFDSIDARIRANVGEILSRASADGGTLRDVAASIARDRVEAAMATRRHT